MKASSVEMQAAASLLDLMNEQDPAKPSGRRMRSLKEILCCYENTFPMHPEEVQILYKELNKRARRQKAKFGKRAKKVTKQ